MDVGFLYVQLLKPPSAIYVDILQNAKLCSFLLTV